MISVVVPAYNAGHTISDCVQALKNQQTNQPVEIIVVDNNSNDQTAQLAEDAGAKVIIATKRGAAAARNAGAAAARGDIICFTDADCCPTPNWIEEISAPLRHQADVIGSKGTYLTTQKEVVARFVQIEYEDKYDLLYPQETINFIDTYSAAYQRDVFLANQGFDEDVFYVEDQEFSFRLAARAYTMVFAPQATVYHLHSATLPGYFRKKLSIGYWKAQIVRRFPTRGVADSHTPQVMKVQMVLVMGLVAALLGLPFLALLNQLLPTWPWEWLTLAPLLLVTAFTMTTLPFVRKAWAKDRNVAVASPFLLAVRALALSIGYGWGTIRPQSAIRSDQATTIGGLNYILKRAIDIVGALVGLSVTAVVGPFIALAIWLDSGSPIIFCQERIGQEGQPFTIYKFRSMRSGAEKELHEFVDLEQLKSPAFKLADDPRVTRVGRWLRRWSLDELPQFWNVLIGDMSLVGPRPEESRVVALYEDWHRRRLAVKPGISGPMQVNGRGDLAFNHRIELELEYIENYSIWRDLGLLIQTIPTVITGKGAR